MIVSVLPGTGRGTTSHRLVVEGACRECCDRVCRGVSVAQHVGGRDVDDAVAVTGQECVTLGVMCGTGGAVVRLTVDFDDRTRGATVEVSDIGANGMLLAELHANLLPLEALPKQDLGQAHVATEFASKCCLGA